MQICTVRVVRPLPSDDLQAALDCHVCQLRYHGVAMAITVSIVEDNEQLRTTLARVISRAEGFRCLSQYGDAESALEALPKEAPEVVLMDINLPNMNGVECVRRLKQTAPNIQVVMLTVYEDTENIFNALAAGAAGYLLKRTKSVELLEAIREVRRGGSPMTT